MTIVRSVRCDAPSCGARTSDVEGADWAHLRVRVTRADMTTVEYVFDACPICQARPLSEFLIAMERPGLFRGR